MNSKYHYLIIQDISFPSIENPICKVSCDRSILKSKVLSLFKESCPTWAKDANAIIQISESHFNGLSLLHVNLE